MNRFAILAILLGSSFCFQAHASAQPAPAEKGLAGDGPEIAQTEGQKTEGTESASSQTEVSKTPEQKIAELEAEVKSLRTALEKFTDPEKDLERLQGKINVLEGENTTLAAHIKALESAKDAIDKRLSAAEADNLTLQETVAKIPAPSEDGAKQQTAAKPAFTYAAVRFHNHESRALRMNVNGIWHTLEPGENDVWVAYGPVHIYRYTGSEPKLFWDWKPYKNGYLMEFDVGKPTEKE